MFRKAFISLVAAATLAVGSIGMTSAANANHRHHRHHHSHISLGFFPFLATPAMATPPITMTIMITKTADTAG